MTQITASLLVCLLACPFAYPQTLEDDATPETPEGVWIELCEPEAATNEVATASEDGEGDAGALPRGPMFGMDGTGPELRLDYDGATLSDVLIELSDDLETLIVCRQPKLLDRSLYLHQSVPQTAALRAVAATCFLEPLPALILCAEEELRENEDPPAVDADTLINIKLEDAELGPALEYLTELTGVQVASTEQMAAMAVTYAADEVTVREAVEAMAQALECESATGYELAPRDVGGEIRKVEAMSDEELEKLFAGGLEVLDRAVPDALANNPEVQKRIQTGMWDAMRMYAQGEPAERRETVRQGAEAIHRLGGVIRRLSPETQQRLRARMQPFVKIIVAGYIGMPSQVRAELSPLMKAFQSFGW